MQSTKKMGLVMLAALVCGNMIGSGIFLLPSSLAGIGSVSLLSWIFTGVGALCLALVFAHMSTLITKTGGPYSYARVTLGEFIGFQTAYSYWVAIWVGNAAIAIAMVGYLRFFFPVLSDPWYTFAVAAGVVWLFTLINLLGVRSAGFVQAVTTVLKLLPILLVGLLGWFYIEDKNFTSMFNITQPHISNFSAISMGAALTFWAFIGLESATIPAGYVKNPKRNIPLATIVGTSIAAIVYIASSTAIMGMIPAAELKSSVSPFADAARMIVGPWGAALIAVAAIISCLGALNGWVLLQGQVAMAAANDQLFPPLFAKLNKNDVPAKGIVITSLLITILLLLTTSKDLIQQFNIIILLAVLANVIPYLYTAIAQMLCLQDESLLRAKKYGLFAVAFVALCFSFWAIYSSGIKTVFYGSVLLLTSVPFYAWVTRKKFHLKLNKRCDSNGN